MNRQESKYFNTACLFDETLILLINQKDIDYITIKEICEKAGFNRSTFYLHYENINDLLEETLEYIIKKFLSYFNNDSKKNFKNLNELDKKDLILINNEYLEPYLEFVRDNKKIFLASFKYPNLMKAHDNFYNLKKYIFYPILDKFNIPNEKKEYMMQFYINGIMAIIKQWVLNDCKDEIKDIIEIIVNCVNI